MKLSKFKIRGFRSYRDEVEIKFEDLTVFVGRNDIGKSTILEALDIFFNEGSGAVKPDKNDINVQAAAEGESSFTLTGCFSDLPETIIIDETAETSLRDEYMLNGDGMLEIVKTVKPGSSKANIQTSVRAIHPVNAECADLLQKKQKELQKIIKDNGIPCGNLNINSVMRKAIWEHYSDSLELAEVLIDTSKGDDTKEIWGKLSSYLPLYSLFQSDRKNTDADSEVQDPLKAAVKEILDDQAIRTALREVADTVVNRLKDVSGRTLDKLREMDPTVANSLNPVMPDADSLKWGDVFKNVSIAGDENIPINKRGSGVKRLILLNFFRAEAERRAQGGSNTGVIYAVEEPETSQHSKNQKILIEAFKALAGSANAQVVLTTHSPTVVKSLDFSNLRLILDAGNGKQIVEVQQSALSYPSLNEVNYIAFEEIAEEYHNELFGYIKAQGWYQLFSSGKKPLPYNQLNEKNGSIILRSLIKTEIIRNQIHHPENPNNPPFTVDELKSSIEDMRQFIIKQCGKTGGSV